MHRATLSPHKLHEPVDSRNEIVGSGNQGQHQVTVAGKIIEVPRMHKYVAAIASSRSPARLTRLAGPLGSSHATFMWGNAEIFERPLRVQVSTSRFPAKLACGESSSG